MTDSQYEQYEIAEGPLQIGGVKALAGANYFSAGKVIVLRLDLGPYDEVFTSKIPGFLERLRTLLPSLQQHHCSLGVDGGFFARVAEGTLLGHVTEHVAIELQTLAGMDVGFGKTRGTASRGIYNVVFRYLDEHVGIFTAKAAVNLVNAVLLEQPFDVQRVIEQLIEIRELRLLGPSTQTIVDGARARGIPVMRLDEYNLVQLGTGRYRKRIRATITTDTSLIGVEIAENKHLTAQVLGDAGLPTTPLLRTADVQEAIAYQQRLGQPVVVKPCIGQLGRATTLRLTEPAAIERAMALALTKSDTVLVQPTIPGRLHRLLVIDFRLVAAARLEPPAVVGDGTLTVAQLIEGLNADPLREVGDKGRLTQVWVDEVTSRLLGERGYALDTVLAAGERLELKVSGSLRSGGASHDVSEVVHPDNRMLAERAARAVNLNVAGVDIITEDIGRSLLSGESGTISAVSAAPDFRVHLCPLVGEPRPVAEPLVEMLFPRERRARVPVIAVTGTVGKTTTVSLLARCLGVAGFAVGHTSSQGLFVGSQRLRAGEQTGAAQAAMVLKDPTIDCALFEVPVEVILDRGLGYDLADVGIVLNVQDEGKTYDETRRLEDIAYAKSVVAEQVYDDGYALLNADDDLVYEMAERAYGHVVLLSTDQDSRRVRGHVERGGRAVVLDSDYVTLLDGRERIDLVSIRELTETETLPPLVLVAAATALFCVGVSVDTIRRGMTG